MGIQRYTLNLLFTATGENGNVPTAIEPDSCQDAVTKSFTVVYSYTEATIISGI